MNHICISNIAVLFVSSTLTLVLRIFSNANSPGISRWLFITFSSILAFTCCWTSCHLLFTAWLTAFGSLSLRDWFTNDWTRLRRLSTLFTWQLHDEQLPVWECTTTVLQLKRWKSSPRVLVFMVKHSNVSKGVHKSMQVATSCRIWFTH